MPELRAWPSLVCNCTRPGSSKGKEEGGDGHPNMDSTFRYLPNSHGIKTVNCPVSVGGIHVVHQPNTKGIQSTYLAI